MLAKILHAGRRSASILIYNRLYTTQNILQESRTQTKNSMDKKDISYSELKALIAKKSEGLLLVDVRSQGEVDNGKIPGSIHIPVDSVECAFSLDPVAFQEKFGVKKPPLDAPELVFHCQMGRRGAVATEKARSLGYSKAVNYAGGYSEWKSKEQQ